MTRTRQLGKQRVHVEFSQMWVHLLTLQGAIKPYTLYRCIRRCPNNEIAPRSAGNEQLTLDLIIVFMSGLQIELPRRHIIERRLMVCV